MRLAMSGCQEAVEGRQLFQSIVAVTAKAVDVNGFVQPQFIVMAQGFDGDMRQFEEVAILSMVSS